MVTSGDFDGGMLLEALQALRAATAPLDQVFEELESQHGGLGWVALWSEGASEDSRVETCRALAYFTARRSRDEGECGPIGEAVRLWLISGWGGDDSSTFINLLTGLQFTAGAGRTVPAPSRTSLVPFLTRALAHPEPVVRHGVLDLLVAVLDGRQLGSLMNRAMARLFAGLLSQSLSATAESDEEGRVGEIVRALHSSAIRDSMPVAPRALRRLLLDLEDATDSLGAQKAVLDPLLQLVRRRTLLDDAGAAAAQLGTSVQTVRVASTSPSVRLVDSLWGFGEAVAGQQRAPHLHDHALPNAGVRVMAGLPASFPVHLTYESDDAERVFDALEKIFTAAANPRQLAGALGDLAPPIVEAALGLLGQLEQEPGSVEIVLTRPTARDWQRTVTASFDRVDTATLRRLARTARGETRARAWVEGRLVPQANTVRQVLQAAHALVTDGVVTVDDIDEITTPRQVSYYKQGARILGLLDEDNVPTRRARALDGLDERAQMALTVVFFEDSAVGTAWQAWAGVARLIDLDPESAEDFLQASAIGLSGTTPRRRASTLRTWFAELAPFHYAADTPHR